MDLQNTVQAQNVSVGNNLYQQVIEVATAFLGPAAERFIKRQIVMHLHITSDDLTQSHLPELAKWVRTSAKLLTDQKTANDFADKISSL